MASARQCAFCQCPANSREHIWADWINNWCKPPTPMRHVATSTVSGASRQWFSLDFNQRTRYLCHECNTEWLSKLESAVGTLLGPMMQGGNRTLDVAEQTLVAAWVAKTAMMLQYTHASVQLPIPRRHFDEFQANGEQWQPPRGSKVWLARYDGTDLAARYNLQPLEVESAELGVTKGPHAYGVTLSVCHLAMQMFGCGVDIDFKIWHSPLVEPYFIRIWPPTEPTIDWPPVHSFNDAGFDHVSQIFSNVRRG